MDKNLMKYEGSKKVILLISILTILQAAAIVAYATYLAKAIVQMYNRTAWSAVLSSFSLFFIAFVAKQFFQWTKSRISYRFAEKTSSHYQQLLVEKLFTLGPKFISKEGTGNMVTLALEGVPTFRTYLELFIPRLIGVLIIPMVILLWIFNLDVASGIILMVVMPILIAFLILLGMVAKKHKEAKWESYLLLSNHFLDSLRGVVTLKYLGKSKEHKENIGTVSDKYRIATNRTLRIAFLSRFSLDFFSSLSVAVVAVELGLRLIKGSLGLEPALLILILAPEYFRPVQDLGNDYHATTDGKHAGQRIHEILEKDALFQDHGEELPNWNEDCVLEVKNVSKIAEEEGIPILQNIHFRVEGLKKIGIIGLSGSGKSTLIDLLSGFTNFSSGSIEINGEKVRTLSCPSWLKQVTYIPQHPYIFSGTVRENIAWYEPDAPLEKIEEAVRITGLSELVDSFPFGLDEKIGQGGRVLSGGEEQRIALARAFLAKKPILLFDEPTAHLDIETEHDIKQMMLPLLENKLVFFATHRLHWMKNMDHILVLDKGRLVEWGTEEELMAKKGAYYELVCAHRGGTADEII